MSAEAILRINADALKLNLSGGTITGVVDHGVNKITSSYVPLANPDITNKLYVDGQVSSEATLRTNADTTLTTNLNTETTNRQNQFNCLSDGIDQEIADRISSETL